MIWTIKKVSKSGWNIGVWTLWTPLISEYIRCGDHGDIYKRIVKMRPRLKRWCLDRSILNIWEHSGPCGLQSRLLPSRNPPSNPKIYFTCKHLKGLSLNVQGNISISMSVSLKRTLTYPPVKTKKFLFNQEKRNLSFIFFSFLNLFF